MSEAKKLAEEISRGLPKDYYFGEWIEQRLQPTFDLLAKIHKLAKNNGGYGDLDKIRKLTRKYQEEEII